MSQKLSLRQSAQSVQHVLTGYIAYVALPFAGKLPMSWVFGVPLLLFISLCDLSGHLLEQSRRHLVLAQGKETQALVRAPTGIEFVTPSNGAMRTVAYEPGWLGPASRSLGNSARGRISQVSASRSVMSTMLR